MSATCRAQSARRRRVSASTSGAGAARPGLVDDMAQKSTCPIQKEEYGRRYATQPADKSRLTCWFVIQPTGSARSVARRCAGRPDTGTSRFIRSRTTLSRSPRQPPLIRSKDGAALTILHRDGSVPSSAAAAACIASPLTAAVISGPSAGIARRPKGEAPPRAQPVPGPLRQKIGNQYFHDVDFNGNGVILVYK